MPQLDGLISAEERQGHDPKDGSEYLGNGARILQLACREGGNRGCEKNISGIFRMLPVEWQPQTPDVRLYSHGSGCEDACWSWLPSN